MLVSDAMKFVEFACPECKKRLKAPIAAVGKRVKCSGCNTILVVPGTERPDEAPLDNILKLDSPAISLKELAPLREEKNHSFAWQKKENRLVENDSVSPPTPIQATPPKSPSTPNPAKASNPRSEPLNEEDLLDSITRRPIDQASIPFDADEDPTSDLDSITRPLTKPNPPTSTPIRNTSTSPSSKGNAFDDEEFHLAPEEEAPKAPSPVTSPPKTPATKPPVPTPSSKRVVLDSNQDSQIVDAVVTPPERIEGPPAFRFQCKVCGTLMYATLDEVGTATKCPDCYDLMRVPNPPANWNPATAKAAPRLKDEIGVSPVQKTNRPAERFAEKTVNAMFEAAEKEADEEQKQNQMASYEFDLDSWWATYFGFLKDPTLLIIAFFSGAIMAAAIGSTAAIAQAEGAASTIVQILVLICAGGPILAICLTNGLAILESTANQLSRVPEWPIMKPGEWMAETMAVVVAFILAAAPGGLLSRAISGWISHPAITIAFVVMSVVLLLPPILLSILDNQSLAQPFSWTIIRTIPQRAEAWGGMYMFVAIASFGLFLFLALGIRESILMRAIGGFLIPFYIFFIFHQIGVLTLKISDLTTLSVGKLERVDEPAKVDLQEDIP